MAGLTANVTSIFDSYDHGETTLGSELCQRLIKEFDKHFLVETNQNAKVIISNIMKALMSLSFSAKQTALNGKLIRDYVRIYGGSNIGIDWSS